MACKLDGSRFRFLRWAILVPLIVYVSFLFVKYNKAVPLKRSSTSVGKDPSSLTVENLLAELESVTAARDGGSEKRTASLARDGRRTEQAESQEDPKTLLETIFRKADTDQNDLLDIQELAKWIHAKITDHIGRALRENIVLFTLIDNKPRNGEISWDEYHAHFLRSHGFPESYVNSHDKRHREMSRALKETVMRDRARWAEAARNDPDRLTLDEFLAFTHPESSHRALLQMVEDLFDKFDRDGDEQLTEDEFAEFPSQNIGVGLDLRDEQQQPTGGSEERRMEFRRLIDKDRNGKADRTELLMYIDPRNPRHAIQEAQHLIDLSDTNRDGRLNLLEILSKTDLFISSKMVDTERSFHDEFR